MARTAVAYSPLVSNSSIADPAGTALDATNDHAVLKADPERTVLRVTNTSGSARTVTVKAGAYPPAIAASIGDLTVSVPASTGVRFIGPFESGRFAQFDGSLAVDIETGHTGTITAFRIPRYQ